LTQAVHEWRRRHASGDKPFLYYSKSASYVTVYDGRSARMPSRERYDWPAAGIIEQCSEVPKSLEQIRQGLEASGPGQAGLPDQTQLDRLLAGLLSARVLYEERGRYLTLALPTNPNL
jgi:hypothetical protein